MHLVKIDGDDPLWKKYADLYAANYSSMDAESLRKEAVKLWHSKLELLAHLEKAQIEIKLLREN